MKLTIGKRHTVLIPAMAISEQLKAASAAYCRLRDESGEGASTFPQGKAAIYRISYNGRVWLGDHVVQEAVQ